MAAAIMCGGKGSRLQGFAKIEKPLLNLNGRTMVELVLDALLQSEQFYKIVAVTSRNTPITSSYIATNLSSKVDVIETDGITYPCDISVALNIFRPYTVFVVGCDLPLIGPRDVKKIVSQHRPEHACTSVVSDKRFVTNMGINPSVIVRINSRQYCHTGISIFDSSKISGTDLVDEHYIVINQKGVAVNVNTISDFETAQKLMSYGASQAPL
jgi:adenosylcobinamide-phosphate guanylyltransferase